MRFCLFLIFASVTLTLVARASHAASPSPAERYWNYVLQETPMPKALSELIQPDKVRSAQPFDGYNNYYTEDKKLVYYNHGGGTDSADLEDPTQVVFFFEEKLRPGTTMKLSLARNTIRSTFLSKTTAESIPFSVSEFPEILNRFGVKPGSSGAHIMKETLETCESKVLKGEDKQCATSLESMVDYATSKLGRNVQAISTQVENGATLVKKGATLLNYTITTGVKKLADADADQLIVCHRLGYGYAVFYCHTFGQTRAYMVPLQALDGTKAKAVAICHVDTSEWNPKNFALLVLKVKPGTVPVCHFLPEGHVAWVANKKSN